MKKLAYLAIYVFAGVVLWFVYTTYALYRYTFWGGSLPHTSFIADFYDLDGEGAFNSIETEIAIWLVVVMVLFAFAFRWLRDKK